jgi:NAD(P)H-dependent FMN reductase
MKIVTVLGSPRKNGCTAAVLAVLEAALAQEHAVERINVVDYNVGGCRSCYACQRVPDRPGCAVQDDVPALLEKLLAADAVVLGTPIYGWTYPAQLKALLDREFSLVKQSPTGMHSLCAGKRSVLVMTCAWPAERSTDLLTAAFPRQCDYLGCECGGTFAFGGCFSPEAMPARAEARLAEMIAAVVGQPVVAPVA